MSTRRQGTPSGPGKPLRPTVAHSRSTGSPLTPRLAPNGPVTRPPMLSNRPKAATTPAKPRSASPTKELQTPIHALLDSNVTPRSSARSSRGGSAQSTPSVTDSPSHARPKSTFSPVVAAHKSHTSSPLARPASAFPISGGHRPAMNGPRTTLHTRQNTVNGIRAPPESNGSRSPMFFHADEARQREPPPKPVLARKEPEFFFANGTKESVSPAPEISRAPPVMRRVSGSSFLYANGTSEPAVSPMISPAISISGRSPFLPSPALTSPPIMTSPLSITDSDPMLAQHTVADALRSERPLPTPQAPMMTPQRRSSYGTPSRGSHTKSASVSTPPTDSPSAIRQRSATWTKPGGLTRPSTSDGAAPPFALNVGSAKPNRSNSDDLARGPDSIGSPSRNLAEVAAEARRERKVLDLEISNSSLLALNRSLERDAKKLKAELKHYRRLTRSGRLSINGQGGAVYPLDEDGLPAIFEGDEGRPSSPFEDDVSDMSSEDESLSTDGLSSVGRADRDAQHRDQDESRLRRDLRKHRDLLLDTQRMNQGLQRCLFWTESLIKDGKKALDYRISSIELPTGGRVLSDDEHEDNTATDIDDSLDDSRLLTSTGDLGGMEAFVGLSSWAGGRSSGRLSLESGRTDHDSGVGVGFNNPHKGFNIDAPFLSADQISPSEEPTVSAMDLLGSRL